MRNVGTLTQRELSVLFYSPVAYVVITIFLVVAGIFFGTENFKPGAEASVRVLFGSYFPLILVFILPMITMRLLSEEYRSGTIESLMTAPVTESDVILGKFFGALLFYVVMLATTLVFVVIVALFGPLDKGLVVSTYMGLLLLGALYTAVGVFFSACTKNQIIAVLSSFVLLALLTFLANWLAGQQEGLVRVILQHLSIMSHYQDFARGLIDSNHVIFFLSSTGLFLFFAVKVLEFRRWR